MEKFNLKDVAFIALALTIMCANIIFCLAGECYPCLKIPSVLNFVADAVLALLVMYKREASHNKKGDA